MASSTFGNFSDEATALQLKRTSRAGNKDYNVTVYEEWATDMSESPEPRAPRRRKTRLSDRLRQDVPVDAGGREGARRGAASLIFEKYP